MGETNSPSVAHVGYDISPLSRVKLKKFKFNSLEWRNIVTHGHLKENLYIIHEWVVPVIEGYLTLNLPIQSVNVIPACVSCTQYNFI